MKRISIILLALALVVQLPVYAAEKASWTPDTSPRGGRQGPTATWTKTAPNLPRTITGPDIWKPQVKGPTIPSQLQLSPSQRAMLQPTAKPAPAQQPAAPQPVAQQLPASQTPVVNDGAVPIGQGHFTAPQDFPQGPVQQPVPISQINVPSPTPPPPSFAQIAITVAGAVMSSVTDYLKDLGSSAAHKVGDFASGVLGDYCDFANDAIDWVLGEDAYRVSDDVWHIQDRISNDRFDLDDDSDLATFYTAIIDWNYGQALGALFSRKGFTPEVNTYLNSRDDYSVIFQLGFLQGIMDSECDPDMYAKLYDELLKKLREAEEKAKQAKKEKDRSRELQAQAAAGMSGSGSGSEWCP